MRQLLVICFVYLAFFAKSQTYFSSNYDTLVHKSEWSFNGLGDLGATSLNNELYAKFIRGGYIDTPLKDQTLANHGTVNRFGLAVQTELNYINYRQSKTKRNFGIIFKTGVYGVGSAVYSKDLAGLSLFGNQHYLGQTIDLSGSKFDVMSFQKIGFGFIHKKTKSYITLNAYGMNAFAKGVFQNGQIFQTSAGDSLSVLLKGSVSYCYSNSLYAGYGIGIDGEYNFPFLINENRTAILQLSVKNLGVGYTTSPVVTYDMSSGHNYTGATFDQLVNQSSGWTSTALLDSLGIQKTEVKNQLFFLPGFLQIGKIADALTDRRLQSIFGIRMYFIAGYSPLLYIGGNYKLGKHLQFGCVGSYGGFTNFRASVFGALRFNHFTVQLATEDVYGTFSSQSRGQAYSFSFNYNL
jgi:hypothetical protein